MVPTQDPLQWVLCLFIGGKAAGAWHWPPTPSSAKVKEKVELYLYFPSGLSWPVLGWAFPFLPNLYLGWGLLEMVSFIKRSLEVVVLASDFMWPNASVALPRCCAVLLPVSLVGLQVNFVYYPCTSFGRQAPFVQYNLPPSSGLRGCAFFLVGTSIFFWTSLEGWKVLQKVVCT